MAPRPRGPSFSLLVVTVPILLVLLIVQNAAALVFPAWASLGPERATGFEVMGQRLAWMLGTFVGASLMLVPAALAGGFAYLLLSHVVGEVAWLPAAFAAAVVVLAESSVAILWLGRVFERLDPELRGDRMKDDPRYPQLSIDVASGEADDAAALLFELGAQGVEERDETTLQTGPSASR